MLYYKSIADDDLWLGRYTDDEYWSDITIMPNELLTQEEYIDLKNSIPRLNIDKVFVETDIDEDNVYEMFGARFEEDNNWNNESVKRSRSNDISEKVDIPDNWSKENKTIVRTIEKVAKSLFGDKWNELSDKQQHDVVMTLAKDLTKYLNKFDKDSKSESVVRSKKNIKERYSDDIRYVFKDVKSVRDSDGFMTEYTMYYDSDFNKYVFVFGDTDLYDPNDGYEEFDYECDTEKEAREWFEDYTGFDDDDDFYESSKPSCADCKTIKLKESYIYDDAVMFINGKEVEFKPNYGIADTLIPYLNKSEYIRNAVIDWILESVGDDIVDYRSSNTNIADIFENLVMNAYEDDMNDFYIDVDDHKGNHVIEIFNRSDIA